MRHVGELLAALLAATAESLRATAEGLRAWSRRTRFSLEHHKDRIEFNAWSRGFEEGRQFEREWSNR